MPELIAELRTRPDPYERPLICLPNREVQSWVKNEVAEALGVCMNFEFVSIERALSLVAREHGVDGEQWSAPALARAILASLEQAKAADEGVWRVVGPLLEPVAPTTDGIAHEVPPPSAANRDRRAYRFAAHLARLLLGYSNSHPELLPAWRRGEGAPNDHAAWQAELWRAANRMAHESGRERLTPVELARRLPSAVSQRQILVFGYAYLAPMERALLRELADRTVVQVFLDVTLRDEEQHGDGAAPLARWAHAAKLTDADVRATADDVREAAGDHPRTSASLETLRRALGGHAVDTAEIGEVLQVFGAPGPRREAEVVAGAVWNRLVSAANDRLSDVAVYSAQYEAQVAWLEDRFAASHRLLHSTPHGGRASRMLDVAVELLELPERGARRDAVLSVLTHECFRGRREADSFSTLAASAGIYLGLDQGDEELQYLEGLPRFHWDQGLARLQLGTLVDGETSVSCAEADLNSTDLPWARESAAQLHAWASSLLADLHTISTWMLSGTGWARVLEDVVRTYLAPRNDADGTHWAALLGAVRALATVDDVAPKHHDSVEPDIALGGSEVAAFSYPVAVEMVRDQLGTHGGARGQFLTNGVAVTRLIKNRAVPFKTVFITGLGEGRYPTRELTDPLDVRGAPGSGIPPREVTNRQLQELSFLQALLSAEQSVVLTWTSKDTERDADLAPSALVEELCDAVPGLSPKLAPLFAHGGDESAVFGSAHDPTSGLRRDAQNLRLEIDAAVEAETKASSSYLPSLASWQEQTSADDVQSRAAIAAPPTTSSPTDRLSTVQRLTMWSFINFLKDPVEATAQRLGLSPWTTNHDEEALVDTEPFSVDKQTSWAICRDVLRYLFDAHRDARPSAADIRTASLDLIERRQRDGVLPHGALMPPDAVEYVIERADLVVSRLEDKGAFSRGYDGIVVLGPGRSRWPGRRSRRALSLNVGDTRVEITHERGCLFGPPENRLLVELSAKTGAVREPDPDFRQRIEMLLLLLAGEIEERSVVRGVFVSGTGSLSGDDYQLPTVADARAYLEGLVRAMSTTDHARVLPLEALGDITELVALARAPRRKADRAGSYRAVRDVIARTWRHREDEAAAQGGALRSRNGLLPPSEDELYSMVGSRFGPLVDMGGHG